MGTSSFDVDLCFKQVFLAVRQATYSNDQTVVCVNPVIIVGYILIGCTIHSIHSSCDVAILFFRYDYRCTFVWGFIEVIEKNGVVFIDERVVCFLLFDVYMNNNLGSLCFYLIFLRFFIISPYRFSNEFALY